jgi:hypothetical protein
MVEPGSPVAAQNNEVAVMLADDLFDDRRGVAFPEKMLHSQVGVVRYKALKRLLQLSDMALRLELGLRLDKTELFRAQRVGDMEDQQCCLILPSQVARDLERDAGAF